ncbi:MAG: hypothetical protein AAFR21_13380 [Pseudomonadota bacterium]
MLCLIWNAPIKADELAARDVAPPETATSTRWFRSIVSQATPVADFVGRGEFDASGSTPEDGVRFSYDAQGRLIRIANYINGRPANLGSIGASAVRFEYPNGYEIRTYWDATGAADAVWRICYRGLEFSTEGTVHKEVFELDDQGRRSALRIYDKNGDPTNTHYGARDYTWVWLDDNKVIEMRQGPGVVPIPMTHFFDFNLTRITFDGRGIHWLIENVEENGDLLSATTSGVAAVRFEYNETMNEADYSFYDADDRITERRSYGCMPHGYARITNSFGEDGRLLEEAYRDRFNQLTDNSDGFARATYDYDDQGQFVSTRFISLDGSLIDYSRPY